MRQTEADRDAIMRAVLDYLHFSDENRQVAEEIAAETAHLLTTEPEADTGRLSFKQKIALAARATIRHAYTAYDDVLIENTLEQADLNMGRKTADDDDGPVADEVTEFIKQHRRKDA